MIQCRISLPGGLARRLRDRERVTAGVARVAYLAYPCHLQFCSALHLRILGLGATGLRAPRPAAPRFPMPLD